MFNLSQKLSGYYSWEIINADGTIASKSQKKNNLILNQGLEYPSTRWFAECFAYCAIGTGSVAPLLTDTGLLNESKRTGNLNSATFFITSGIFNIRRVFDFSPETESRYYGELGWSPFSVAGNNLFSKALMVDQNGNPGLLQVGRLQFLRVTYTLQISFSPSALTSYTPVINNWSTIGNASSQYVGLVALDSTGAYTFADAARDASEPSNNFIDIFISTGRATPSGLGSAANYSVSGIVQRAILTSYVANSYTKSFHANFGRNSGVGQISTIGCGLTGSSTTTPIFAHLMNAAQTKASDYELGVYFSYTWGRA